MSGRCACLTNIGSKIRIIKLHTVDRPIGALGHRVKNIAHDVVPQSALFKSYNDNIACKLKYLIMVFCRETIILCCLMLPYNCYHIVYISQTYKKSPIS